MTTPRKVQRALGVDFGTSNSYFSDVKVGGAQLSYTDLKFGGQSSVPTCVLYKRGEGEEETWVPHRFGEAAIEEWKNLFNEEREDYRFRAGFKPDIAFEDEAYLDAVSFFRLVRDYLEQERLVLHFAPESGRQVVVGVPAQNVAGQEQRTLDALAEAGLHDVVLIPEPEGALFYHLYYDSDRITVDKAHEGVVVVDFGGGTFDVAFLQDGVVQRHWGNPMLGGRLFDDLFFQWFLEMQDGDETLEDMKADENLDYLRSFGFRMLKERFSLAWKNQQLERFRERVTVGPDYDYGVFRRATVEAFHERARAYEASPALLADLEALKDETVETLRQGPVDLMSLIRQQLSFPVPALEEDTSDESGDVKAWRASSVRAVVLTGGSCRWPFMMELVQEAFPEAALFQSPDPEATISRGLAMSYAFRDYAKEISERLSGGQEALQVELMDALKSAYEGFAKRSAERFTSELYSGKIQPVFRTWREDGGSVEALEQKSEAVATAYFTEAGLVVLEQERERLQLRLAQVINDKVLAWLKVHHITRVEFLSLEHLDTMKDQQLRVNAQLSGVMDEFFATIGTLIAGVVGVVVASLAGGGGVALLMTGPLGWLLGLVLGAAATGLVFTQVDTKKFRIPSWILKMAASDERLAQARESFNAEMQRTMMEIFVQREQALQEALEERVAALVRRLAQQIPVTAIMQDQGK